MSEIEKQTISIQLADNMHDGILKSPRLKKSFLQNTPRPVMVGLLLACLAVMAWGTSSFLRSSSRVDESESVADLDGFESAPSFEPTTSAKESSPASLGTPAISFDPPSIADTPSIPLPVDEPMLDEQTRGAEVWLTGTIEETEPSKKPKSSRRLSGGPNESSVIR